MVDPTRVHHALPEPEGRAGRLPAMNAHPTHRRLGLVVLFLGLLVVACSSGAAPSAAPSAAPTSGPADPSGAPPDGTVSSPPDVGSSDPGPGPGGGKLVVPRPGQLDVHPIAADGLAARVDGHTIIVTATWTSGVEPCTILDSIVVDKGLGTMSITLREGHGPEEIACIAIAEQHRTEFEIPDVPSGTWTIQDTGGLAAPVEVTVD